MEARIRELEKAAPREVIDVDAATENTMVVFEAIESLRKDTEEGWNKLAVPLDRVIEANNASTVGLMTCPLTTPPYITLSTSGSGTWMPLTSRGTLRRVL